MENGVLEMNAGWRDIDSRCIYREVTKTWIFVREAHAQRPQYVACIPENTISLLEETIDCLINCRARYKLIQTVFSITGRSATFSVG